MEYSQACTWQTMTAARRRRRTAVMVGQVQAREYSIVAAGQTDPAYR